MLSYITEYTLMATGIKDQSLIPINMCSVSTGLFGVFFDGLPIMCVYVVLGL